MVHQKVTPRRNLNRMSCIGNRGTSFNGIRIAVTRFSQMLVARYCTIPDEMPKGIKPPLTPPFWVGAILCRHHNHHHIKL